MDIGKKEQPKTSHLMRIFRVKEWGFGDWSFLAFVVVVIFSVIGLKVGGYLEIVEDDSSLEEQIEDVIQEQVGISVDLSPSTPE